MFSTVARRTAVVARAAAMRPQQASAAPQAFRQAAGFSDSSKGDRDIPDTHDTGPQRVERTVAGFNREPIHPPPGSGTKEMPFEVPSEHQERVVGFEHPESHAMYWFPLAAGKLHYVEEIDGYFKLVPLS